MISLCITNYNRYELLINSFIDLIYDDRISEIVISDDYSDINVYHMIEERVKQWPKVKLYRNESNLDCYFNKREVVSKATNEWVILLDSDNVIDKNYADQLYSAHWNPKQIFQPSYAMPHFDFRKYETFYIDHSTVAQYMADVTFQTMLNASNYFVNRDEYLKVWDGSVNPVTSDSIFMAYNWINAGNSFYIVPNMHYQHRVDDHAGEERSHYAQNYRRTERGFHESIVNKLKAMK